MASIVRAIVWVFSLEHPLLAASVRDESAWLKVMVDLSRPTGNDKFDSILHLFLLTVFLFCFC